MLSMLGEDAGGALDESDISFAPRHAAPNEGARNHASERSEITQLMRFVTVAGERPTSACEPPRRKCVRSAGGAVARAHAWRAIGQCAWLRGDLQPTATSCWPPSRSRVGP
jgi:hypothetical protein